MKDNTFMCCMSIQKCLFVFYTSVFQSISVYIQYISMYCCVSQYFHVLHYARKKSPGENGYCHFGQNRAQTNSNWCLAFSTFTFKQGENAKSDQINNFQCILYTFKMHLNLMTNIQYILVLVYLLISTQTKVYFLRDYSTYVFNVI